MKMLMKSLLGVLAVMLFTGSVIADTIRPSHAYDDDWDDRVMRFTPEWHENDVEG